MPYLFRRICEIFFLFITVGVLYTLVYRNIQMPDNQIALPISYGGFMLVAFFAHVYFLNSYLQNIGNVAVYLFTNITSYVIYMIAFYGVYFLGNISNLCYKIYEAVFRPYDLFTFLGMSRGFSSLSVHIISLIIIVLTPVILRINRGNSLERYLNHED